MKCLSIFFLLLIGFTGWFGYEDTEPVGELVITGLDYHSENQRWTLVGKDFKKEGVFFDVFDASGKYQGFYEVKFRNATSMTLKPFGFLKLQEGVKYQMLYRTVSQTHPTKIMDFTIQQGQALVDFKLHQI